MPSFVVELHLPMTFPRQGYYLIGFTFDEAVNHARGVAQRSRVRVSMSLLRNHLNGAQTPAGVVTAGPATTAAAPAGQDHADGSTQ